MKPQITLFDITAIQGKMKTANAENTPQKTNLLTDRFNQFLSYVFILPMSICDATWIGFFLLTKNYFVFFIALSFLMFQSSCLFKKDLEIPYEPIDETTPQPSNENKPANLFQKISKKFIPSGGLEKKIAFVCLGLTCLTFFGFTLYHFFNILNYAFAEQLRSTSSLLLPNSKHNLLIGAAVVSQIAVIGFAICFLIQLYKLCKSFAEGNPPDWWKWLTLQDQLKLRNSKWAVDYEGKITETKITDAPQPTAFKVLHYVLTACMLVFSLGFAQAYQSILLSQASLWMVHADHVMVATITQSPIPYFLMFGILLLNLQMVSVVSQSLFKQICTLINTFSTEPANCRIALAKRLLGNYCKNAKGKLLLLFFFNASLQYLSFSKLAGKSAKTNAAIAANAIMAGANKVTDFAKVAGEDNEQSPPPPNKMLEKVT
jgi:hypothetical protein